MFINNINYKLVNDHIIFPGQERKKKTDSQNDNFSKELKKMMEQLNGVQNKSDSKKKEFILNKQKTSLNDVMIHLQKASISMQFAIQVRNKVISAYQEIMNQQV